MAVTVKDGALLWTADVDTTPLQKHVKEITGSLNDVTRKANEEASAIEKLMSRTALAIGAYASFAAGSNFVSDIVRVRGEFQQLEVAFTTMLGSKEKADKLMAEVTEFAATTPFELKDVAAATKQLLAFGIGADDIKKNLKALGDVSAGIGQPLGEIAYLFGTIKTAGVAMTQDIRQFAQRGIPIYEELAKVLGVTVEQVGEFVTAGKVGFPEIERVFQNLTAEGSKFGGLMEAQSKTLVGQISNLRDAFDQMLNNIGRSGEGIFSDAISGLTFLVDNYETVIDILKVLVATYGSYRAAIIATNTLNTIALAREQGLTVAMFLKAKAAKVAQVAQALLNKTMLANPAVALITGLTGIITALALFGKRASEAKSKAELLADANEKVADQLANIEGKIRPYVDALKNANLSEEQRLDIYNKLKAIDPAIVAGLDAKTLSYKNLSEKVDAYVASLRKQFAVEANKEAIDESIKAERNLQKEIDKKRKKQEELIKQIEKLRKRGAGSEEIGLLQFDVQRLATDIKGLDADLREQQKTTAEFGKTVVEAEGEKQEAKLRTLAVIDEEIKALKNQQTQFSTNSKQYQDYQAKINALEEERKRITGASTKELKGQQAEENKLLALLEKRKNALEAIRDLERDAIQSGLLDDASEIDKINERREKGLQLLKDTNAEIERYNRANKKNVELLGQAEIDRINKAADTLIRNTQYKQDADEYLKAVQEKKKAFEEFQKVQEQGNTILTEHARKAYADQLGEFDTFVDMLQAEYDRLFETLQFDGTDDIGAVTKFNGIKKLLDESLKESGQQQIDFNQRQLNKLLEQTETFNQKRAAINKKYNDLEATLEKNKGAFSPKEYEDRLKIIKEKRAEDLTDLDNNVLRQSAIYKKLSTDIIGFTRKQIRDLIKELEAVLKNNTDLTPEVKAAIQSAIKSYKGLLNDTNDVATEFAKTAEGLSQVSGIFGELGNATEGLNDGLSEVLSTLSDMTSIAADAANAIAQFAKGTPEGTIAGIASIVSGIGKVLGIGKRAREERRREMKEIEEFQTAQFVGEQEINLLYQERARQQVLINKLRIQGLNDEKKLLLEQRNEVAKNYQTVFDELQKLNSKIIKEFTHPIFGTRQIIVEEALFGKSFDELEQLFLKGQLEGKAKELFQELQKIKESGVDIDRLLQENKIAAQELFTGTTAENIADTIIQGLQEGKRSVSDFADTFEDLMKQAFLNSLKFKYLEGPIKAFFEDFAAASESDGQLTSGEIDRLREMYNTILTNATNQFEQLQDIAGLNISGGSGSSNTLQGAIRGMTETQAELLAGQFGGMRITLIEQLRVAMQSITILQNIEMNTSRLHEATGILRRLELNGIKVL